MDNNKIIGLITTTRSSTFKVIAELYGGPRFETQDFFSSKSAACLPDHEEEVADHLHELSKRDVRKAVREAIARYEGRTYETPAEAPAHEPLPAPTEEATGPTGAPYVVAEKPAPASGTPAAAQMTADTPKTLSERLKAKGLTSDDLAAITRKHFPSYQGVPTKAQYLEAFSAAEVRLNKDGIEALRSWINPPASETPVTDPTVAMVFSSDPAVKAAMAQVSAKWPMWGPELTRVAALWCADHAKDANTLDAFLVAGGVNATTPPGKIESVLAITRHLALNSMPKLLEYAKKSGNPFSMIESDLSAAVGKPIRFSVDIDANAVSGAFARMTEGK